MTMTEPIPEESLIEELRRLGDPPDAPPRKADMDEYGRYSSSTYYNRYGSWPAALEAAGYEPIDARTAVRVPKAEVVFDVRLGAVVLGHSPSADEYAAFGTYSKATAIRRFGSWPAVLDAADLPPTGEPVDLTADDVDPPDVEA